MNEMNIKQNVFIISWLTAIEKIVYRLSLEYKNKNYS